MIIRAVPIALSTTEVLNHAFGTPQALAVFAVLVILMMSLAYGMYACMHVCMYLCMYVYVFTQALAVFAVLVIVMMFLAYGMYACMCLCMCLCMYVCVCIYSGSGSFCCFGHRDDVFGIWYDACMYVCIYVYM
jgi:hypothetical protein